MIYITGDMHGERARFYGEEEKKRKEKDYIIVCGDFGFLFRNDESEHRFLDELETRPYTICFLAGNHENYSAINQYPVEEWKGGKIHRIRTNIVHLMNGQVFEMEGRTIFTMGGAFSIDRELRELNVSYWEEELPAEEDYHEAICNLKRYNSRVDYILTHTAPGEMIRRLGYKPNQHDMELTGFLEYLMYEVQYKHWYCGHFHQDQTLSERFTVVWLDILKIGDESIQA